MLLSVFGAISSLGWPGMVTVPGFVGCWKCRWLPRWRTRDQPSDWTDL